MPSHERSSFFMEPIGLMHIEKVFIPKEFIRGVYDEFRATGQEGYERVALFAGVKQKSEFLVSHLLYPRQKLIRTAHGLAFHVDGDELERIWEWLYANTCSLIAQIHSHPSAAYHSPADDALAIITTFGGLSIVVPDFGNSDESFEQSAFFRLLPSIGWTALTLSEIENLIKIID